MAAGQRVEQPRLHPWLLRPLPDSSSSSRRFRCQESSTEMCALSCGTVNLFQTEERPAWDFAARDQVHAVKYSFCRDRPSLRYGLIPAAASIPVATTSSLLCPQLDNTLAVNTCSGARQQPNSRKTPAVSVALVCLSSSPDEGQGFG